MKKVYFTKINSANVAVNNLVDETKVYNISANINLNDNELNSIDSGFVMKDGVQVATFSMWSNSLTPSFQNVTDPMEMCNILMAITTFIADIKNELNSNPIEI